MSFKILCSEYPTSHPERTPGPCSSVPVAQYLEEVKNRPVIKKKTYLDEEHFNKLCKLCGII